MGKEEQRGQAPFPTTILTIVLGSTIVMTVVGPTCLRLAYVAEGFQTFYDLVVLRG